MERERPSQASREQEILDEFMEKFALVAGIQGRIAYLLMSIHGVQPGLWGRICSYDPTYFLFANMLYGTTWIIFSKPSMESLTWLNRTAFSILGSMMFNYSTIRVYEWLITKYRHRPILLTGLSFLCGRLMIIHLAAYLYHVERNWGDDRDSTFETMYS